MAFKIPRVHSGDRLINQLQQNICLPIESQFQDISGQFVVTLSGCDTTVQGLATWQKASALGPVTIFFPGLTGESNTTAAILTGLPSALWPLFDNQVSLLRVEDNGVIGVGTISLSTNGIFTLAVDVTGAAFTASGTKGISSCVLTYLTVLN